MNIRFLPFLASMLGLNSINSLTLTDPYAKPRDNRRFRSVRDRTTKSFFGHRWTWQKPHIGSKQAAKLEKRAVLDAKATAGNYAGWCGRN